MRRGVLDPPLQRRLRGGALACALLALGCTGAREPGAVLARSADGALCGTGAPQATPVPGGFDLFQACGARFCPQRASVRYAAEAPDLPGDFTLVGARLVRTHRALYGCGASACEHTLTAWWWQDERWVIVQQIDGATDDWLGEGPPFELAWSVIRARCEA